MTKTVDGGVQGGATSKISAAAAAAVSASVAAAGAAASSGASIGTSDEMEVDIVEVEGKGSVDATATTTGSSLSSAQQNGPKHAAMSADDSIDGDPYQISAKFLTEDGQLDESALSYIKVINGGTTVTVSRDCAETEKGKGLGTHKAWFCYPHIPSPIPTLVPPGSQHQRFSAWPHCAVRDEPPRSSSLDLLFPSRAERIQRPGQDRWRLQPEPCGSGVRARAIGLDGDTNYTPRPQALAALDLVAEADD